MSPRPVMVTGEAGTGKTRWLQDWVRQHAGALLNDRQNVLVMSFMHGARRRLASAFSFGSVGVKCQIRTIDSFSTALVNRWRRALGLSVQVQPTNLHEDLVIDSVGARAGFEWMVNAAAHLAGSATVARLVAAAFPIIVVDEFQDCSSSRLLLLQRLAPYCQLVLAGDEFQVLVSESAPDCPAIDWVKALAAKEEAILVQLAEVHRTRNPAILRSASSLRRGAPADGLTVPVIQCAKSGLAAWAMLQRVVFGRWTGRTALICPTRCPTLNKVLDSFAEQLAKRHLSPIRWRVEHPEQVEVDACLRGFECDSHQIDVASPPCLDPNSRMGLALRSGIRLARLRGWKQLPVEVLRDIVSRQIHATRAFGRMDGSRFIVTTVHSAKNREFDNVILLWPIGAARPVEAERRLVYNAVTRAKTSCVILVIGSPEYVGRHAVFSLLNAAVPAIPRRSVSRPTGTRGVPS